MTAVNPASGRKARAAMLRRARKNDTPEAWNRLAESIEQSHAAHGKEIKLRRWPTTETPTGSA